MVVANKKSLEKDGGKDAACAIIETYYQVCKLIADPETQDKSLFDLGKKFADLDVPSMKKVVQQTRFYATPEMGIHLFEDGVVFPWDKDVTDTTALFTNKGFSADKKEVTEKTLKELMPLVVDFCQKKGIIEEKPTIGYGPEKKGKVQLLFDPSYMKEVLAKK